MATLGVIGLGNIGGGIAVNLIRAGNQVRVFDSDATRVDALSKQGALSASSAHEAVVDAQVVFTSLPGPQEIRAVGVGDGNGDGDGIIAAMAVGAIWVELSTNNRATVRELGAAATLAGIAYLDAPVSGGPEGAAAGTLSLFVGGDAKHFADVQPLLEVIGSKVMHVGALGAGVAAKIAQVTLCYTQTVALIEALLLGVKAGVKPETMLDLIRHSAGQSYCADIYGPEILAGTYDASFPMSHAAKDMRLARELAEEVGAELPMIESICKLYAEAETTYGATAPHLCAAHLREQANNAVLHEMIDK